MNLNLRREYKPLDRIRSKQVADASRRNRPPKEKVIVPNEKTCSALEKKGKIIPDEVILAVVELKKQGGKTNAQIFEEFPQYNRTMLYNRMQKWIKTHEAVD